MRALLAFSITLVACGTAVDLGGAGIDASVDATACGPLVAPSVTATCRACNAADPDCQPNGCYGGYWCNETSVDCHAPPKSCP